MMDSSDRDPDHASDDNGAIDTDAVDYAVELATEMQPSARKGTLRELRMKVARAQGRGEPFIEIDRQRASLATAQELTRRVLCGLWR